MCKKDDFAAKALQVSITVMGLGCCGLTLG